MPNLCLSSHTLGVTAQKTAAAPTTTATQVVKDVASDPLAVKAAAPSADPFGIFGSYDPSNYGVSNNDVNFTISYEEYDTSAYTYCLNASDVFDVFAQSNVSLSVRVALDACGTVTSLTSSDL